MTLQEKLDAIQKRADASVTVHALVRMVKYLRSHISGIFIDAIDATLISILECEDE